MKILLHCCCAPCSIYPFKELFKENQVSGFYFNPNIHPYQEFTKRREALEEFSRQTGFDVIFPSYEPSEFFRAISYNEHKEARCGICWHMRLKRTADFAKENGFDTFTTTLLISPYQDQLVIKEMGESIAKETGVDFYYQDFREGFRASQNEARDKNLYRQKYCGCIYSEMERFKKK